MSTQTHTLWRLMGALPLIFLLLAGCNRQPETPPTMPAMPPAAPASATPPVTTEPTLPTAPAASPTPPLTPTATAIPVSLIVTDQTVAYDGRILINEILAPEAGWLVVRLPDADNGEILGLTAVAAGYQELVEVVVDPLLVAPNMEVVFHVDHGQIGVFEYPGPDIAWQNERGEPLTAAFAAELAIIVPAIIVADQDVGYDGLVTLRGVANPVPAWLRLYADEDGEPDLLLGSHYLTPGEHEDLTFFIDWRRATPRLHARLYEDKGESRQFDPDDDAPLLALGRPVAADFTVYLPPDVFILNQPLVDDAIVIERAISYGPGWVAVYRDQDGRPDLIIGRARLEDGVNKRVTVPLTPQAVTQLLHVYLHQDTGEIGVFEFPVADPQIRYEGRLPNPFSFWVNQASYLWVDDPTAWVDGRITLPLVVAGVDLWLAIRADEEGEPGEPLAYLPLPAGIHWDVVVEIDLPDRPVALYAVLHLDAGEPGVFEYPNGPDAPIIRERRPIAVPFTVE